MMLLLIASAVTAGVNPTFIWYDIGWYLSFLAFFGVLVVAPTITARIYKKRQPSAVSQLVIESAAAQIMVMPLLALVFEQVSLIGFVANVVILPLIPLAMLLAFIAGVAGMLVPSLAGWLAWPADLLLTFIVRVVRWFASFPKAASYISISWWQLTILYSVIFGFLISVRKAARPYLKAKHSLVE
jgi:competence protein ComEC